MNDQDEAVLFTYEVIRDNTSGTLLGGQYECYLCIPKLTGFIPSGLKSTEETIEAEVLERLTDHCETQHTEEVTDA